MVYAVDFVIDIMTKLSSSKPVMFQRDGSLFIASEQGFGQVTYGLQTRPKRHESWQEEALEILESQDIVTKRVKDCGDYKMVFGNGEKKYIQPIVFGTDNDGFTLEDMMKSAAALQKLPDDKKIRMVSHGSRYHSHKYGYAADGIDVWVETARVMNRERYLELVRKNETDLVSAIAALEGYSHQQIGNPYEKLRFPDCVILTPNMQISFPRKGRLNIHTFDDTIDWNSETRLEHNRDGANSGSILRYGELRDNIPSLFNIYVTLNASSFKAKTAEELANKTCGIINQRAKELEALRTAAANSGQDFIERINSAHNKACAQEIERFKKEYPKQYERCLAQA